METAETEVRSVYQDETLQAIKGVEVYNTQALENKVVRKIHEDIKQKQLVEDQKKIKNLKNEIGVLKHSIEENDQALSAISKRNYSEANLSKLKLLRSQNEKYQQKLNLCQNKLIRAQFSFQLTCHKKLATNKSQEKESDDFDFNSAMFEGSVPNIASLSEARTIKERKALIKQGLATPFSLNKEPTTSKSSNVQLDDGFGESIFYKSKKSSKSIPKRKLSVKESQSGKHTTSVLKRNNDPPQEEVHAKKSRQEEDDNDYLPLSDIEESTGDSNDDDEALSKLNQGCFGKTMRRQRFEIDDANPKNYKKRVNRYRQKLLKDRIENYEDAPDKLFEGGLRVPGRIWERLYKYQQTGVKWLWELHSQQTGGILGDEMGLGKTIQVIAFLAALHKSKIRDRDSSYSYDGLGPVLIVTPATVMHQWVRELHAWAPLLRVAILHSSGSHKGSQNDLIKNISLSRGILVTSYERVRLALDNLLAHAWHYVILDEGHKIRNPEAGVTHAVKMFPTPHRLILSGSPIQNHLRELWSLFDFVFPGKLGTLPVFMEQFSIPIVQGGYANASEVEVQTAYKCACMLRNTIAPYLLRRMKQDVQSHIKLPEKNDQVLFCSLTDHQVEVYENYLKSDSVHSILSGNLKVFVGLIQLRKLCNHPDLYTGGHKLLAGEPTPPYGDERRFGFWKRSGKMIVVDSLLRIWQKQGKKVLLFTQSKQMLEVLEDFVKSQNYTYLSMHGGSAIGSRQPLIEKFNEDPNIFVFILTTRVGGLGVNLIGADRVIIYDPDWNPSTDAQAQERAWRIGQKKQVTIYRLLTTGTIEEKIYHRQIFKHFVSNRILKDPKQRRFFKANDMHELFILNHHEKDSKKSTTETAAIFAGTGSEVKIKPVKKTYRRESHSQPVNLPKKPTGSENLEKSKSITSSIGTSSVQLKGTNSSPSKNFAASSRSNIYLKSYNETSEQRMSENDVIPFDSSSNKSNSLNVESSATNNNNDAANHSNIQGSCASDTDPKHFNDKQAQGENDSVNTVHFSAGNSSSMSVDSNMSEDKATASTEQTDRDKVIPVKNDKPTKLKASFLQALRKFQKTKQHNDRQAKKAKMPKRQFDVDGEAVSNVVRKSKFKHKQEANDGDANKADDYVLTKLFNKGVHSAMKHTKIMDSATADYALVEAEASRVAKEAVRNLRLSRQQYKYPQIHMSQSKPRFGKTLKKTIPHKQQPNSSSEDDEKSSSSSFGRSAGPASSSELLKQMRKRNHIEVETQEDESEEDAELSGGGIITENDQLLQSLVDFIGSQHQSEASTQEIVAEFKSEIEVERAPNFKAMLNQICESQQAVDGETKWILKPEFQ